MFTEKIHMTGIYSVNTRKRTHVIDITVPDSSLQTSYGIARCQYRSQHFFGVSRENFGCARKLSFIFTVILVNFRIIGKYRKEDLGDEDLFYDEVISDANGELYNCKNQYANCICRPNNILITTFFFSSISVIMLLILRKVFRLMLSRWRLSHIKVHRDKVESSERFVNIVLENLSKRFARIDIEISKTQKCTTTIKTHMILKPISMFLID